MLILLLPPTTYFYIYITPIFSCPSMPQPLHHPSCCSLGHCQVAPDCPSLCTTFLPIFSALANHPPSSQDWHRSPASRPSHWRGPCSWLHGTVSSACRSHSPFQYLWSCQLCGLSSEPSWCWHWIHNNVGLMSTSR